jgi:hypothetical protein
MQLPLQDVVFNQKRVAGSIVGGRSGEGGRGGGRHHAQHKGMSQDWQGCKGGGGHRRTMACIRHYLGVVHGLSRRCHPNTILAAYCQAGKVDDLPLANGWWSGVDQARCPPKKTQVPSKHRVHITSKSSPATVPHSNRSLLLVHADMDAMLRLAAARGISPMIELMPMNKVGCLYPQGIHM